jgi:drug/metabolite transporter (DMT)-like permease
MQKQSNILTYSALCLAMLFWSLSYIGIKIVLEYISPSAMIFIRLVLGSIFFIGLSLILKKLRRIDRKDMLTFIILAFFQPFIYYLGESYGVALVSSTVAAIIISTIPLFLPFSMYILAKERISKGKYAGITVSFIGVLLVILNNDFSFSASPRGIFYLMIAVLSVMGYSYILQGVVKKYNAFTIISAQNFIGIFYLLPLFLIFDLRAMPQVHWNAELLVSLISLAIFATALAFFLFTVAIRRIGITRATVFTYIIPVLTAIFSFLLLKEDFTTRKTIGILLVIAGLFLSQINYRNIRYRMYRIMNKPSR